MKKWTILALVCALGLTTGIGGSTVSAETVTGSTQGVAIDSEHFPGPLFRYHILTSSFNRWYDNGTMETIYYDGNQDGFLSEEEAAKATYIGIQGSYIQNVTGIEYFTSLIELGCQRSGIQHLDLSKNTKLQILNCFHCNLQGTLDLSKNVDLEGVACHNNRNLTGLDVSNCTKLFQIDCSNTGLTEIDVKGLTKLQMLAFNTTAIETVDVSTNAVLQQLSCYGSGLKALDVSRNPELEYLDCSASKLECLDVSNNPKLAVLNVSGNALAWLELGDREPLELQMSDSEISLTVRKGSFDLTEKFPGIDVDKVTVVSGATLDGKNVSGYDFATPIVYQYDCGTVGGESVQLKVTLSLIEDTSADDQNGSGNTDGTGQPAGDAGQTGNDADQTTDADMGDKAESTSPTTADQNRGFGLAVFAAAGLAVASFKKKIDSRTSRNA